MTQYFLQALLAVLLELDGAVVLLLATIPVAHAARTGKRARS